jgi:hypothetical protein
LGEGYWQVFEGTFMARLSFGGGGRPHNRFKDSVKHHKLGLKGWGGGIPFGRNLIGLKSN